jgi:hypothetical protein
MFWGAWVGKVKMEIWDFSQKKKKEICDYFLEGL